MTLPTALTVPTPDIEDVARTSGIPTAEIVAILVSEEVAPHTQDEVPDMDATPDIDEAPYTSGIPTAVIEPIPVGDDELPAMYVESPVMLPTPDMDETG
jgi:hypothetical protein